jgi:hypothetical protein
MSKKPEKEKGHSGLLKESTYERLQKHGIYGDTFDSLVVKVLDELEQVKEK